MAKHCKLMMHSLHIPDDHPTLQPGLAQPSAGTSRVRFGDVP